MTKPRIGLVGFGAIGKHHARNLAQLPVDFVGVADVSKSSQAEISAAGFTAFDGADVLLRQNLDGVIIAAPTAEHEALAIESLAAVRGGVLVEKPLAHATAAGERIVEEASRLGKLLMIGYVERYNPGVAVAKAFVEEGNCGDVVSIGTRRVGVLPPRIKDANVLVDIGVHDIDAIAFITNDRLSLISAQGGSAILGDRVDYAFLTLATSSVIASVETNWITPVKIRDISITGTRGYLHVDYITQEVRFAPAREFAPGGTYQSLVDQYVMGEFVDVPVAHEEPLAVELRTFVRGLGGGPIPDPSIALESLRIAEEATALIERRRDDYVGLRK